MALSQDNREACSTLIPSGCVPYTGYVSDSIKTLLSCRPNINDIFKVLQNSIDSINLAIGDNKQLTIGCFTDLDISVASQKDINQSIFNKICTLTSSVTALDGGVNPDLINLAVDLLCLADSSCEPKASYTLTEVIVKLLTNYCSLLTRVQTIESTLNL